MNEYLILFLAIPIAGFLLSLFLPEKNEKLISGLTSGTVGLVFIMANILTIKWLIDGRPNLSSEPVVLFNSDHYRFGFDLLFDKITAIYLLVGSFLTFLVTVYSSYYLHRENGYKRFFNTILFFFIGYMIIIFSGNLETLFTGWEILGISSFLLIAFYRDRYLPVKNAIKVFSIYRIGDVGLLLAMWMSHHLFHENITFLKLNNYELVSNHLLSHSYLGVFISFMFLIAAYAKSAQMPFSSWLPRAMEGPTPSSAIFYGSLSVHIGVFLMLRTFPFWEHQLVVRIFIAVMGLISMLLATGIARVQSSVKSQIAYSSIAQIGIIFVELALGLENLALFHFAGNAFLRTYQLLVSPSVVSYLIREQFYNFSPREKTIESYFPEKLRNSLYVLSLKEWNLDSMMYQYLWNPMKTFGKKFDFLTLKSSIYIFIPAYFVGIVLYIYKEYLPAGYQDYLPIVFSIIGLVSVMKAFVERKHARLGWFLVILNHFWVALAISFNENFSFYEILIYLSGIIVFGIIGIAALQRLKKLEGNVNLVQFHGHVYEHPKIALLFFISCLGVTGFPITPTFIGEDLIYSHIHEHQIVLACLVSLSFILDGLAIIRIYGRVFLGPHLKTYHEIAYRSS